MSTPPIGDRAAAVADHTGRLVVAAVVVVALLAVGWHLTRPDPDHEPEPVADHECFAEGHDVQLQHLATSIEKAIDTNTTTGYVRAWRDYGSAVARVAVVCGFDELECTSAYLTIANTIRSSYDIRDFPGWRDNYTIDEPYGDGDGESAEFLRGAQNRPGAMCRDADSSFDQTECETEVFRRYHELRASDGDATAAAFLTSAHRNCSSIP